MALVARVRFKEVQSARQERYDLGSDVTVWVEYRNPITNALTAAAGVAFAVTKADGSILLPAPSVVTEQAGIYRCVVTPDQPGVWAIEASSTTSGATNDRREFLMASDSIPPTVIGPTAVQSVNNQVGPHVTVDFDSALEASRGEVSGFPFVTDGTTDNAAVWADFVNYCLTHDVVGVLPAGTILIGNSPGTVDGADQINAPAIRNATRPLRIRGAGEGLTILRASVAARSAGLVALVSGPILRLVDCPALHLSDLTVDGGVTTVPTVESGMRALTLTSPSGDDLARDVCTMIETDNVPDVRLERVRVMRFYGHRDNTDLLGFRSRRTGGLCIHRASRVRVRDLTLDKISAREGVYFGNCQDVQIDGFSFDGVVAEQDARGTHALSTPLNVFGPETLDVRITNARVVNCAGSAMNIGGQDITLDNFAIKGEIDSAYGDGLDFGVEHQVAAFGASHPPFRRLTLTNGLFEGCSRYALRAYHEPHLRGGEIIFDNLIFHRCYQGPEVQAVDRVSLGSMIVRDCFFRADYAVSGRGVFVEDCSVVTWDSITVDASGGDGVADYMRYGIYIDKCQKIAGGVAILNELSQSHLAIYQSSIEPDLTSADIDLGTVHCFQTQTRDPESIFAPITLGRTSGRIARLAGDLRFNGAPALLTPGAVRLNADGPALGIQRLVIGNPSESANYNDLLGSLDFVNGDGSGALADRVRARIVSRTRGSNGRGAWVEIETAGRDDARAVVLAVSEHGSLILPPSASSYTPRTRRLGEQWTDSAGQVWRCTASGREASLAAPVGVTATADGSTAIVVNDASALGTGDLIVVGATGPREILAIVGTTLTLDATVGSGAGLAVTAPAAVIARLAAIINPAASYADDAAAASAGVPVGGFYRRTGGTLAWRVS
jgi:hypothetical protein